LSQSANVDVTITDGAGALVRAVESGVSHTGGSCYYPSYFTWNGKDDTGTTVPDGVYTAHLKATNAAGSSDEITLEIGVDTRTPGTLTAPAPGDTLAGLARFVFSPVKGVDIRGIDLYVDTGGSATISNDSADGMWRTSMFTGTLKAGPAVVNPTVRYADSFGGIHYRYLPGVPVVIDVTSVPLAVSAVPSSGQAPLSTAFTITTSDPQARTVHYTVNFGDGSATQGGDIAAPYDAVTVPHTYANAGAYRAVVTVTNGAGAASTKAVDIAASSGANTAPTASLTLDSTSGVVPLPVTATITASDDEDDALTYVVDFGDGAAAQSGGLPHDPLQHTYTKPGTYVVRYSVSDGKLTTVKTATVVAALAEPLSANAGDDLVVFAGSAAHLDGAASRPAVGIDTYAWTFGDGTTGTGAVVDHIYATPGTYTATLTVTVGGESDTDTAIVTVNPLANESGLTVAVTADGAPASDVDLVVIDGAGQRLSAVTDDAGTGHLHGLPDGPYSVYAWKDGYMPGVLQANVRNDTGSASITLTRGEVATSTVTSSPMTYDEIVAAGIDPTVPENQHVYQFEIHLAFTPTGGAVVIQGIAAGTGSGNGVLYNFSVDGTSRECTELCGVTLAHGYTGTVSVRWVNNQPQLLWLVIPGKASWLKEFFDVQMMVTNLASPGITITNGAATLELPDGLSLAPTASPQKAVVSVPDVPGGTSATVNWVVRGDAEGYYNLTASYAGTIEPFGKPINMTAATQNKLHVWGGSALQMIVDADADVYDRYPYHVRIGLKNVADVPVYNATVELLKEGKLNYIYQPREALQQATAEVTPGDTFWTDDYILAPEITGTIDLEHSFVRKTAGDVDLPDKIVSHPPLQTPSTAPLVVTVGVKGAVGLLWDSVPGATSYEIYRTPDRNTDFPDQAVAILPSDVRDALVPTSSDAPAWYAVSAVINGKRTMVHPLVEGASDPNGTTAQARIVLSSQASCGNDVVARVEFSDNFFDLTRYTAKLGNTELSGGTLLGKTATVALPTITKDMVAQANPQDTDQATLTVRVEDANGGAAGSATATVSVGCNPIRVLVMGDSVAWGQGLERDKSYAKLFGSKLHDETHRPVEFLGPDETLAHSGAVVSTDAGCSNDWRSTSGSEWAGEVPMATPDIDKCQRAAAKSLEPDVILVDGCINDVGVTNIFFNLNPLYDLAEDVRSKCGQPVRTMLENLHDEHRQAQIVYTGYYQIADDGAGPGALVTLASMLNVPGATVARLSWQTMVTRAVIFDTQFRSTAEQVVSDLNNPDWLHFADPKLPFNSGVFNLGSRLWNGANDPAKNSRGDECIAADARYSFDFFARATCPFASLGHPNDLGAVSYKDAILRELADWMATQQPNPIITKLSISPAPLSLAKGTSRTLTITATYSDGSTADATGLVSLTSSDPSVVAVDTSTASVTAIGAVNSQATITATLKDTKAQVSPATSTVTVAKPILRAVEVTPTNPLLIVKKSVQMKAIATLSDGTTQDITATAQWSSSNTSVATTSTTGLVKAVAIGTASITGRYTLDGVSASGQTLLTVLSGAPKITSISPESGAVGTKVVIQGTNLLGASSVSFGGVIASQYNVDSSSQITATVPAGAKSGTIQVVTPLGTAKSSTKFRVR
jgi:PKD repeat protein